MGRSLRALALAGLLALPTFGPAVTASETACAAEASGAAHAALVVDTGARTTTYCVALDAGSVSGLHLIQLAGRQYGLDYSLGFGGQAVCRLDGVGPSGGDCFADYPDFWGYWHGGAAGGWSWAGSGAGSSSIGDGDMDGWAWGSGDSGSTHAAPPSVALEDVCEPAPSPSPSPGGGGGSGGSGGGSGGGGGTGGFGGTSVGDGGSGGGGGTANASPSTGPSATPSERPSAIQSPTSSPSGSDGPIVRASPVSTRASASDGDGGPPLGSLLALAAAAVIAAAGWVVLRRRNGRTDEGS